MSHLRVWAELLCRYRNQTGVEIRAVDFGGLGGIDALDPGLPRLTPLYSGLTKAFKDEGYEERKDLFGAPYDFRLAGDGLQQVWLSCNVCDSLRQLFLPRPCGGRRYSRLTKASKNDDEEQCNDLSRNA